MFTAPCPPERTNSTLVASAPLRSASVSLPTILSRARPIAPLSRPNAQPGGYLICRLDDRPGSILGGFRKGVPLCRACCAVTKLSEVRDVPYAILQLEFRRAMKRTLFYLLLASAGLVMAVTGFEMLRDWRERPGDHFSEGPTLRLAHALMANDEPSMRALIENGADINAKGVEGMTLLQWQVGRGDYSRVRRLLALGADPDIIGWGNETATHLAAFRDSPAMLELLLDGGADPNTPGLRLGRTPIFNALAAKNGRSVELLIERGSDVSYRDTSGSTLLHYTARTNYFQYVLRFLELGVDPLALDDIGTSFQPAFFRTDPTIMSADALDIRRRVAEILVSRGIELAPGGEGYFN